MKCPKCSKEVPWGNGVVCPNCGVNMVRYSNQQSLSAIRSQPAPVYDELGIASEEGTIGENEVLSEGVSAEELQAEVEGRKTLTAQLDAMETQEESHTIRLEKSLEKQDSQDSESQSLEYPSLEPSESDAESIDRESMDPEDNGASLEESLEEASIARSAMEFLDKVDDKLDDATAKVDSTSDKILHKSDEAINGLLDSMQDTLGMNAPHVAPTVGGEQGSANTVSEGMGQIPPVGHVVMQVPPQYNSQYIPPPSAQYIPPHNPQSVSHTSQPVSQGTIQTPSWREVEAVGPAHSTMYVPATPEYITAGWVPPAVSVEQREQISRQPTQATGQPSPMHLGKESIGQGQGQYSAEQLPRSAGGNQGNTQGQTQGKNTPRPQGYPGGAQGAAPPMPGIPYVPAGYQPPPPFTPLPPKHYKAKDVLEWVSFLSAIFGVFFVSIILLPLSLLSGIYALAKDNTCKLAVAGIVISAIGLVIKIFIGIWPYLPVWLTSGIFG